MTAAVLSELPYLEPVPVSEPPFDDVVTHRRRTPRPAGVTARVLTAEPAPATLAEGPAGTGPQSAGSTTRTAPSASLTTVRVITPAVVVGTHIAPPPGTPSTDGRRTSIAAAGVPPWSSESDVGVRRTGSDALPPAARSGRVFARALVEVLSGRRPLGQLRVHCAPDIYAGLLERTVPASVGLPHLLAVRVCEPADGVAEVSAAFKRAQRVRAIAFRIQGVDGRWRITALEVG